MRIAILVLTITTPSLPYLVETLANEVRSDGVLDSQRACEPKGPWWKGETR